MAFYQNPGAGNPQGMYDNAAMAAYQQGMPPNQQRMQHPGGQFPPGAQQQQQQFAQFQGQMHPSYQAQFQQQQGQPGGQPHPQFRGPNAAQMQQLTPQQIQQMRMAQAAQQRAMQSPGPGDMSSMMPPSSGPMNMGGNMGATMQQGNMQRPQGQAQARGGPGHPQFAQQQQQQDAFNFNAPPSSAGPNMPFFPQPTPSPTQAQTPSNLPPGQAGSPQPQQQGGMRKPTMPAGQRPSMGTPLSPAEQDRNEKRVTALFGLNAELIKAAAQLQSEGRGKHPTKGQNSPTAAEPEEGEKKAVSSQEYIECMRRIQANLAYLAAVSDRANKPADKIPAQPAILDTLPPIQGNTIPEAQLQTLATMYKELKEMFPGAGATGKGAAGPIPGGGAGSPPGPAPVNGAQIQQMQAMAR